MGTAISIANLLSAFLLDATGGQWAVKYFDAIRQQALTQSGAVTSLAMSLACTFTVFRFIKMYYDFVSDEQNGGFGGVRMWDILRPIVIIAGIASFSWFSSTFDSICSKVSSALVSNMNAVANNSEKDLIAKLDELNNLEKVDHLTLRDQARRIAIQQAGTTEDSLSKAAATIADYHKQYDTKERSNIFQTLLRNMAVTDNNIHGGGSLERQIRDEKEQVFTENLAAAGGDMYKKYVEFMDLKKDITEKSQAAYERLLQRQKWMKFIEGGKKGFFASLVGFLFDTFFVIMMAYCEIMLCILLVFGPLVLSLSIFDKWKGAFTSWIGKYIETSLWKPVACGIAWVTMKAKVAIADNQINALTNGIIDLSTPVQEGSILGAIGVQVLIVMAGLIAITKVPSITNSILNLGSEASGGLGSAAGGAATGAALAAPKAVGKAAGTAAKGTGAGLASNFIKAGQSGFASKGQSVGAHILDKFLR